MANHLEMLSGRRKQDYQAEHAADALEQQAGAYGDESTDADGTLEISVGADEPLADEADELSEEADAA